MFTPKFLRAAGSKTPATSQEGEMPMRPKAPCKDCEKRHPGCHGECEAYAEFQKQHDEYYYEVSKAKGNEFYFIETHLKTKRKYEAKHKNRHS